MLLYLKKLQNSKLLLLIIFLLHIFLLKYVVDIKTLLLIIFSLVSMLIFLFEFSLKEVLFLLLLFSFSFEKGIRGWDLSVVSQGREWWMYGYTLYYGLSLRTIFIFTLFLISIKDIYKLFQKKMVKNSKYILYLLVLFMVFSLISTLTSSDYFISFFGFLRLVQAACLFFITLSVFENQKFISYFFISIVAILFLNSYVSFLQFYNSAPIGWFLEDGLGYGNKGFFTTDGAEMLYRTSGLIGHPTFFASYLSMLLTTGISYFIYLLNKSYSKIILFFTLISVLLGMFGIYSSFVRSSWFTILLILLSFVIFVKINNKNFFNKVSKKYYYIFLSLSAIFLSFFGKRFWLRILSSTEFISDGSGVVRVSLIEQAIYMTSKFPILGVGLNLSPRMMNEQAILAPELRGFMFPVHNTFLLFFAELGIPASILFILFLVSILILSFQYIKKDIRFFGIWLGVIGFILNAQVHTLFNQDPSFDLLFLFLGILTSICIKKSKSH